MTSPRHSFDREEWADDFARVALDNITREYPYAAHHLTREAKDRPLPSEIHPAFATSYDWHSSVHMHWLAVRLVGFGVDDAVSERLVGALVEHLSAENLAVEADYLRRDSPYERPYGWGWAMRLAAAVSTSEVPALRALAPGFAPFVDVIADNTRRWTTLSAHPVRHGVHGNSAFGLRLILAASRILGLRDLTASCESTALAWFGGDRGWPFDWERSGQDFLSAGFEEADLLSAVLPAEEFAEWAVGFFDTLRAGSPALEPAVVVDESDGQQVHLFGLNLSRAASGRRIVDALRVATPSSSASASEALQTLLETPLDALLAAGLAASVGEEYYSTHWLASFAWDALEARAR
jgi:hypothetical protein